MEQSNSKPTGAPKPWDFAPGSLESRAAARALAEGRSEGAEEINVQIILIGHPPEDCKGRWCMRGTCGFVTGTLFVNEGGEVVRLSASYSGAAFDEQKPEAVQPAADVAPQKSEPEAEQEPEPQRAPLVESRRRPLVRPLMRGRRAWPPSAWRA